MVLFRAFFSCIVAPSGTPYRQRRKKQREKEPSWKATRRADAPPFENQTTKKKEARKPLYKISNRKF
jgi:hypothetical protein